MQARWDQRACAGLKDDDRLHVDFIVQALQPVLPQMVSADTDGHLSPIYTGMRPLLIEASKELKTQSRT